MLVALALLPCLAEAVEDRVTLPIRFAGAFLDGEVGGTMESMIQVPPTGTLKSVRLEITADHLVVNWTERVRMELAHPLDPSRPYGGIQERPSVLGEREHGRAHASAILEDPASNLVAVSHMGTLSETSVLGERASVLPNPRREWVVGSHTSALTPTPDPNGTTVRLPLPAAMTQAVWANASFTLSGDLRIFIYQSVVRVRNETGTVSYASGSTTRSLAAIPESVAREREYRLLRVDAWMATVRVVVEAGHVGLVTPEFDARVHGRALVEAANASVGAPELEAMFAGNDALVTGAFNVLARNDSTARDLLAGNVTFAPGAARVATADGSYDGRAVPADGPPLLWWAPVAVAAVVAVWVATRFARAPTIPDVEWALLAGRGTTARRLARRLVRRDPDDPDVVFLYAASLLQRADYADVLEKVEPLAIRLAKPERRGVAFVLAAAAHAMKDWPRKRRWAAEASADPILAQRLHGDRVGRRGKKEPERYSPSAYA